MFKKKSKVIVAMSGGVDSSVTAALLKKQGFMVSGVFMKLNNTSADALNRAKKVARVLKIPFFVLDFRKEFKEKVISAFLKEYRAGHTPNPCVVCNKEIKFGLLWERAQELDADYIATGHYIRLKNGKPFRAKDQNKDQSYFLWQLNQKQLKRVLFPVGDYIKPEVRKMAKAFKLPVYATPESQEICFVPGNINDFLKDYFKLKKGKIVDASGKVLGEHRGLIFYTIGQRKGIMLPQGPYWVKERDFKNNVLVVTKDEKDLLKNELIATDVNWLSGKAPKFPLKIQAKIRYRSKLSSAVIYKLKTTNYKLIFSQPQRAITPGQSVVFYKNNELLGGGVIC